MTENATTMNIWKYVMDAPPAEPLTLSPVMLMLLREWLNFDKSKTDIIFENVELRKVIAAADQRLLDATEKIKAAPMGCDTADWLADEILGRLEQVKISQGQALQLIDINAQLHAELEKQQEYAQSVLEYAELGYSDACDENEKLSAELAQYKKNIEAMEILNSDESHDAALEARDSEIKKLEAKLKAAQNELARIKPDWDDAPDWATHIAANRYGKWQCFSVEPSLYTYAYEVRDNGSTAFRFSESIAIPNWRETLERRPEDER